MEVYDLIGEPATSPSRLVAARRPHALLAGHSGSVSANPVSLRLFAAVKELCPGVVTVYGGLYPTFAHRELIAHHPPVDIVARGEGEEVGRQVVAAVEGGLATLESLAGLTWRSPSGDVVANPPQPLIENLDDYLCPHGWTQEGRRTLVADIIQPDQQRWTYRCQVLRSPHLSPWAMFVWVKLTEVLVQVRWRWFWRMFAHPDREVRRLLRWCFPRITAVWFAEILDFLFRTSFARPGSLSEKLVTQLLPGAQGRTSDERNPGRQRDELVVALSDRRNG